MTIDQWIASTSALFTGISAGGIIFAVRQIQLSRKQLNVDVMTKCIVEYRQIGAHQNTTDEHTIHQYLDLVSEELFYIQERYIPNAVCREWLDGMIDFMPITDIKSGEVVNQVSCIIQLAANVDLYLQSFPRIRNAFII